MLPEDDLIVFYQGSYTKGEIEHFRLSHDVNQIFDIYQDQLKELFEILHPNLNVSSEYQELFKRFKENKEKDYQDAPGNWFFFPWSKDLIHILVEEEYDLIRTNRNQYLITTEEQKKLFQFTPAVIGLSVGNSIALTLTYSGIGKSIKIADHDVLSTSNLNRIRAGFKDVGRLKTSVTRRQILEMNPYVDVRVYSDGLTKHNLFDFIGNKPTPKIIFDVIDNFEMKIHIRFFAKKLGIPVLMFANLGDSVLIDVERYDLNKDLPIFNGLVGDLPREILENPDIDDVYKNKYAVALVGRENVPKRALESVNDIGKKLVGRPQLMSTVTISGGIAAYFTRMIALGENVPSGRKIFKLSTLLD